MGSRVWTSWEDIPEPPVATSPRLHLSLKLEPAAYLNAWVQWGRGTVISRSEFERFGPNRSLGKCSCCVVRSADWGKAGKSRS